MWIFLQSLKCQTRSKQKQKKVAKLYSLSLQPVRSLLSDSQAQLLRTIIIINNHG